ncbi:MAG: hypothetical protein FWC61_01925 [Proteobacteria bacterium]|nr:hypothetical protein [Pseudomonadota bacterium]
MPNHIHGIIIKNGPSAPDMGVCDTPLQGPSDGANMSPRNAPCRGVSHTPNLRSPSDTIGAIIRGYKSSVSKRIGKPIWQRNYYEHIIRDGGDYEKIASYIAGNPQTWDADKLFQKQLGEFNKQFDIN